MMYRYSFLLVFLLIPALSWSQTFRITGRVLDKDTKEGIPFCNVYFEGTEIGNSTDVDGYYELVVRQLRDSLTVSAIGYTLQRKALSRDSIQEINFSMNSSDVTLGEVVVIAGENPANAIVKGIIKNKKTNRLESADAFQYESYGKVELDLENIPEKIKNSKLMKPFAFVFENIDSVSDEKPFLPIYINEYLSDIYYVNDGGRPKEVIKAQRTSGTDNQTFIDFVKQIHEPFSVYDDWIYVLEKPLVSPFANSGLYYYEYYIIDSTMIEGQWSYKLKFKPKRKQENTFYGDFWVADSTFAIERLNMRLSPNVNINLVRRIIIYQDFNYLGDYWAPGKQKVVVDFSPGEKAPGMIGRHTETRRDYRINQQTTKTKYENSDPEQHFDELEKEKEYWTEARHEQLTKTEESIYEIVDSIQNVPVFQTYSDILQMIGTGYIPMGKVEFGPYYSVFSNNFVEGTRLRLGARTTTDFSEKIRFSSYLAYGFKDEEYKYNGDFQWIMNRKPRRVLGGGYRKDISLNSESSEDFLEGDIASSAFRRDIIQKLIAVEEGKLYYERFWKGGFSNRITLINRYLDPYGKIEPGGKGFNYAYLPSPESQDDVDTTIRTTEFLFKLRYAFEEEFLESDFARTSLGTKFPIIELQYTMGINGLLGGDYQYHKLSLYYRHYVNINPIGWLSYRFKAGKVFGTAPFLLLEVHPGNEAYFMSRSVFNTMNRYEFASDTYFSVILEHHFDGFILNRVPLFRKLKWRSVVSFKALVGTLSDENKAANAPTLFDPTLTETYNGFRAPSEKPYMEAGVGIENILKIIRIDALWRLSYLDNPEASRFSLVAGFYFYF